VPTLDVAINALKAKHGAKQFDDAAKKCQQGAKTLDRDLTRTQKGLDALGGKFKTVIKAALGMTAVYGIGRLLKSSVQEMAKFEMELANVSTMLDETSMQFMPKYKIELSKLAIKYGEATTSLSKGLYDILSASIDAADALDVLEVATVAAKAGITTTAKAADLLTTIINAYGYAASDASKIADVLFATVKRGKTTFDELASSMGMVVSLAATAGLSLEEVSAALATMTRAGISTDMAVTSLKGILTTFLSPTKQNIVAAKALGLELNTNTLRTIGLTGAVDKLGAATAEEIAAVFSNVRALTGLAAMLQATEGYQKDLATATDSTGMKLEAFNKISDTTAMKLDRMSESWKAMKRAIGDEAKPAIDGFSDAMVRSGPVIGGFIKWIGRDVPDAITEMYFQATLARKKLEYIFAREYPGVLDDIAIEREIEALKIIIERIQGITEVGERCELVIERLTVKLEGMGKATEEAGKHFKDWGEARDFLLKLSGSVAVTAESIYGVILPTEEFTEVITKLKKEIESVRIEIEEFEKTDIEKQVAQFARFEEVLASPTEILKYRDAVKELENELIKLGELEEATAIKEAKIKAGKEVTAAFEELANERKLIGLTNEERERAIKLTEMEAQAKVLLGDKASELTDLYMKELKELQKMREIQVLVDRVREGVGDLVRAPLTALLDETRDMGTVLEDVLRDIGKNVLEMLYEETITKPLQDMLMKSLTKIMDPLTDMLSNLLSGVVSGAVSGIGGMIGAGLFAEKGLVFKNGRVQSFRAGGIINKPTIFPMANGLGLMGEKGPEAVMPLARDESGRLGVRAETPQVASSIKIINVLDATAFEDYLSTEDGEKTIMNIMRRNQEETREVQF